jgi:excisionase family DNA binding protein
MKQATKIKDTPQLLTIAEVVDKLKISRPTLWRLTKERRVKVVKIGRLVRYTPEGVAKLIAG